MEKDFHVDCYVCEVTFSKYEVIWFRVFLQSCTCSNWRHYSIRRLIYIMVLFPDNFYDCIDRNSILWFYKRSLVSCVSKLSIMFSSFVFCRCVRCSWPTNLTKGAIRSVTDCCADRVISTSWWRGAYILYHRKSRLVMFFFKFSLLTLAIVSFSELEAALHQHFSGK